MFWQVPPPNGSSYGDLTYTSIYSDFGCRPVKGGDVSIRFCKNAASIAWNGRQPKLVEKDQADQMPEGLELMWPDQPNLIYNRLIPGFGVEPIYNLFTSDSNPC